MNPPSFLVLCLFCAVAVGDWIAVVRRSRHLEHICKPLATLALIALALAVEPFDPTLRAWFVAALVASLAGDVFLMLPRDLFVPGLAAFLVAHLLYITGMAAGGEVTAPRLGVGLLIAAGVLATVGPRIATGAYRHATALLVPVTLYMVAIAVMLAVAVGTGRPAAVVGAALFVVSDALIGWTRFVRPDLAEPAAGGAHAPLAIMVTYHLGQTGLVLSLAAYGLWAMLGVALVLALVLLALLDS